MKCPHCHTDLHLSLVAAAVAAQTSAPPAAPPSAGGVLSAWFCPVHKSGKIIPAGVSQKTGKPYSAFWACPERGCNEKPPRGSVPPSGAPVAPPAPPADEPPPPPPPTDLEELTF